MARAALKPIFDRLNGASTYHPFTASTFSDWALEAGDTITVKRDGKSYTSPVHSSTIKWAGQQTVNVESTGDKERGAVARMSASNYAYSSGGGNSYRTGARRQAIVEGQLEETDERITQRVNNFEEQVGTRFEQTERSVGMSVGRLKYSKVAHYSSKSKFPTTGKYDTLYVADDTGQSYAWINPPGIYYIVTPNGDGDANYLKVGEIAIAFNEQTGKTEAKLDANVIYAGKNSKGKLVSLADLELPEWMGATDEGIVALQGNFKTLNASVANLDKVVAKALTTEDLTARIGGITRLGVQHLAASGSISVKAGNMYYAVERSVSEVQISQNGNLYTLQYKKWGDSKWNDAGNFNRAITDHKWTWSNGKLVFTASPQNQNFEYTPLLRLNGAGGNSFSAEIYEAVSSGTATRKSVAGYVREVVNGSSSRVNVCKNSNGSGVFAGVSTRNTYNAGYRVTQSQVSGSIYGNPVPTSAGSSVVSGRQHIGTGTRPTVSSYVRIDLYVHGSTIPCYIILN